MGSPPFLDKTLLTDPGGAGKDDKLRKGVSLRRRKKYAGTDMAPKRCLLPKDQKGGKRINDRQSHSDRGQRVNEQIRISPVRLIGALGEQLGVVPTSQAMEMAREANLDLVEVAPGERPPVCKILDYGKFRYQQSRKGNKSKPHQQKLKEIRVRPKTGDHDILTKVNQARKFLEHKDKVLVNVLFRGRELQHIDEGRRIIVGILEKLADLAKIEKAPSMEGKRMTAMLAPKS
jgi:translation initiation factor IF-3